MIPILGKIFDSLNINVGDKSSDQNAMIAVSGKHNTVTGNTFTTHNINPEQPSERDKLLLALRQQWLLSNDGISPARMAGLEWGTGEKDWINGQLEKRGETWRVE